MNLITIRGHSTKLWTCIAIVELSRLQEWKLDKTTNCVKYGKNVLYFFYNIAQRTLTEEWREIFRVDIELYQHGS